MNLRGKKVLKNKVKALMVGLAGQTQSIFKKITTGMLATVLVGSSLPVGVMAATPPAPSYTIQLLAAGERTSVLATTAHNATTSHNGSAWYYNNESMGFANAGSTIYQQSADISNTSDFKRLSWHTNSTEMNGGWRLGAVTNLNDSTTYSRFIYEANTLPAYYPYGPQQNVDPSSLTGWSLCYSGAYGDTVILSTLWAECDGAYLMFAGTEVPVNKIDVEKAGSSILSSAGGSQNMPSDVNAGDSLNIKLYEPDGSTQITWDDYRVYVSNCYVGACYAPGNPIANASDWDAGTVYSSTFNVPESAQGKHLAILTADDSTGDPVNANWIRLEVNHNSANHSITSCEQLMNISTTGHFDDVYTLANDIDCNGIDFEPIDWGGSIGLSGTFDGNGKKISNLTIDRSSISNVGLFKYSNDALFKDITFINSSVTGIGYVGTLVGYANSSSINNVRVTGDVVGGVECESVGGVVGYIQMGSDEYVTDRIVFEGSVNSDCYNTGGIFGYAEDLLLTRARADATVTGNGDVGGLIGEIYSGDIEESSSRGSVTASGDLAGGLVGRHGESTTQRSYSNANVTGNSRVGGLVGANGGTIIDSYATGNVDGDNNVGGLAGRCGGSITSSYSTGVVTGVNAGQTGGLLGYSSSCGDTNNFWDTDSSGLSSSEIGTGKTTVEMKDQNTFTDASWDFSDIWALDGDFNDGYPCLQWDELSCSGDGDSISYEVEDSAPNSGDANDDGISDSEQKNVTSYVNSVNSNYVAIEADGSCIMNDVGDSEESTTSKDSGYNYENGLINFTADCATPGYTTTVKLYFYGVSKADLVLRKFKPATSAYFNIDGATLTESTVDGVTVTTAQYSIKDGGSLDIDGLENGVIVDPVGLGTAVVGAPNTGIGGLLRIKIY